MIIVIDTNVWLSELGLNSHAGTALRFFMHKENARLALPEVVRLEVQRHLRKNLHDHVRDMTKRHRYLLAIFGKLKKLVLPSDGDIDAKVAGFFESLNVELIELPFSIESARASLLKTIDKVAPSDQDQQFKDGVIWADCVTLLDQDDVVLVGADKAFYRDRKYEQGLAPSLAQETMASKHRLTLLHELGALLKAIQKEIQLADDDIANAVAAASDDSMRRLVKRNGFALGARIQVTHRLFVTEQPDTLFIDCALEYECIDTSGECRVDARVRQTATGMYVVATKTFEGLEIGQETLEFRLADGSPELRSNVYGRGFAVVGHRDEIYTVRHALDGT